MITAAIVIGFIAIILWYTWDWQGYRTLIANVVPALGVVLVSITEALSGFPLWQEIMSPSSAAWTILGLTLLNGFLRFKTDSAVGEP